MDYAGFFKESDFDSPDSIGSGEFMQESTVCMLIDARIWIEENWNKRGKKRIVAIISSGVRTISHNKNVGGVDNSSHLGGWAVDIRAITLIQKFVLVIALSISGFRRIGIAKNFIHVDNDPNKPDAIWFYKPSVFARLALRVLGVSNQIEDR